MTSYDTRAYRTGATQAKFVQQQQEQQQYQSQAHHPHMHSGQPHHMDDTIYSPRCAGAAVGGGLLSRSTSSKLALIGQSGRKWRVVLSLALLLPALAAIVGK